MFCQSQAFSAKKSQILSGFLISKKKAKSVQRKREFSKSGFKKAIGNPEKQFSIFIFAGTYTSLLYYVIIRFLCRAQSIIAKFAHTAQVQDGNLTGRLLYMVTIKFMVSYHFDKMEGVFFCGWVPVQLT